MTMIMQEEDRCVFCSQKHEEPKKEKIEETVPNDSGWKRKSMNGVFEKISKKTAIYPNSKFPPPYEYQGHHCVALSAFAKDANSSSPKDKRVRLNHFLKKVGFYPNREQNCIGLPARKSWGDYDAFFESLDKDAPLQMHGPGHDDEYFDEVDVLLVRLMGQLTHPDFCKELSKNEMEDLLKEDIASLENFAFNKLASNNPAWRLHKEEQKTATKIYKGPVDKEFEVRGANNTKKKYKGKGQPYKTIEYPHPGLDEGFL